MPFMLRRIWRWFAIFCAICAFLMGLSWLLSYTAPSDTKHFVTRTDPQDIASNGYTLHWRNAAGYLSMRYERDDARLGDEKLIAAGNPDASAARKTPAWFEGRHDHGLCGARVQWVHERLGIFILDDPFLLKFAEASVPHWMPVILLVMPVLLHLAACGAEPLRRSAHFARRQWQLHPQLRRAIPSALSALVAVGVAAVGFRSAPVSVVRFIDENRHVELSLGSGSVGLFFERSWHDDSGARDPIVRSKLSEEPCLTYPIWERHLNRFGFRASSYRRVRSSGFALAAPCWFVIVLAMLPPTRQIVRWRRAPGPGHCANCGYDLRASTDRCPECGTPIPAGATHAQRAI